MRIINMDNFVFLNITTNYPKQFTAGNTKMEYMAKGLQSLGTRVLAINSLFSNTNGNRDEIGVSDVGIDYITFSSHCRFKTISDVYKTYKLLKERKGKGTNVLIMATSRTYKMLLDILVAKFVGYKTMFLFHEWRGALKMHSVFHKIDAWLKDHLVIRFFDAYLPISHYLLDKCNEISKRKKMIILPVLADYSVAPQKYEVRERFTYCCSVWYVMRHPMLLDAMDRVVEKHSHAELFLVLSGNSRDIENFSEVIKKRRCAKNITIRTKVPFEELSKIYGSSLGLIIPLEPNSIADIARFSQKIAEYIATGRPIITNSVGEIPYYFKNRESAYFADYSVEGFYSIMNEMLENKEKTDEIGHMGFQTGLENFDYKINALKLLEFSKDI